ncbi:MAG: filamentous hemagglutinin family protein [Aquabacterium sp.]
MRQPWWGPCSAGGRRNLGYGVAAGGGDSLVGSQLQDLLGWSLTLQDQPWLYASLQPQRGTLYFGQRADGKASNSLKSVLDNDVRIVSDRPAGLTDLPEAGTDEAAALFATLGNKVQISARQIRSGSVGSLIVAGRTVTMDADVALDLGARGNFSALGLDRVDIAGKVKAEGGTVKLAVEREHAQVTLSPQAILDVSGRVADERSQPAQGAVSVDGGTITIASEGGADLRGATLDVSGGLWVAADRAKGKAGGIDVAVNARPENTAADGRLDIAGTRLLGHDFSAGGSLKLSGMKTLAIGTVPEDQWGNWASGLLIDGDFFSRGGFGKFQLAAKGDVKVFSGTHVVARKENLFAVAAKREAPGSSAVSNLAITTLDEGLRSGVSIALNSTLPVKVPTLGGGTVRIEKDASIDAGVGGAIQLGAGRAIDVGGALVARGGRIDLSLLNGRGEGTLESDAGYLNDQEIRLSQGGKLDVSGVSKTWMSPANGRKTGSVLQGGTVTLGNPDANNGSVGYVVTEKNTLIDVSGASDTLNIGPRGAPVRVSQGAGNVVIDTVDGYLLQGQFKADRPDASVSGGAFTASLTSRYGNEKATSSAKPFPVAARETLLLGTTQDVDALVAKLPKRAVAAGGGEAKPVSPYAQGVVSTEQIAGAGFDRITFASDARIKLGQGANFLAHVPGSGRAPVRSLVMDTRVIQVADEAQHTLAAHHVALGSTSLNANVTDVAKELAAAVASGGKGSLTIQAGLIDVQGYLGLAGVGQASLEAVLSADQSGAGRRDGEIRFIGRQAPANKPELKGQLNFAGELDLTAGNVYATTLSDFTLNGVGTGAKLALFSPIDGSTSASPLSALGKITFKAPEVLLDGSILQPFGQIKVSAAKLSVGDHARLSVSGDGSLVPVGTTLNQQDWQFSDTATARTSTDATVQKLDDVSLVKSISLEGKSLSLSSAAVLSAQSGGDLQAWEFVPGVGGTDDELGKSGYYAIVPGYKYDFAPHDTEVMAAQKKAGTSFTPGDQVTIQSSNGLLAAGTYTLLPARYALMPGAVLVEAVKIAADTRVTRAVMRDDGSVLVAGYKGSAGTGLGNSDATAALVLTPRSTLMSRSQYKLTSINALRQSQAALDGKPVADTAANGGRVQLAADQAFDLGAKLQLKGGELDLYMGKKMAVVAKAGETVADHVAVSADVLDATGARQILLGGTRSGTVGDAVVEAQSDEVYWASSLDTASELLTVAKNKVSVADGVVLRNTGAADETAQTITLHGEGAALALTSRVATDMVRDGTGAAGAGALVIGDHVTLVGPGVLMDATGQTTVPDSLSLALRGADGKVLAATQALSLGAGQLLLGESSTDPAVMALGSAQLASLADLQRLSLNATRSITTSGSLSLGQMNGQGQPKLKSLQLNAPQIIGAGKAGDTVTLTAQQVTFKNSSAVQAPAPTTGAADLGVVSRPALNDVQTGGIAIAGNHDQHLAFHATTLDTTGDVVIEGKTSRLSTQGDLTIQAARITGTNLANKTLKAGGTLSVAAVGADRHTLGESRGAGASLTLQGQRVVHAGRIDLASGKLIVTGAGGDGAAGTVQKDTVIFQEGATTNVAGRTQKAGTNWAVSSGGGSVSITAEKGDVRIDSLIDVSAAAQASDSDSPKTAGSIEIHAKGDEGQVIFGEHAGLKGEAARDSLGGTLAIDADGIQGPAAAGERGTLDAVARLVNAGRMTGGVDLRLRRNDQSLNTTLKSQRVTIAADQGRFTLMGQGAIDARAPQGGVVGLFAKNDLILADGASIQADSTRAGANGGDVLLSSTQGHVIQDPGATVSARGDAGDALDGRIVLRAGIDTDALGAGDADPSRVVKISVGDVAKLKAGEVVAEAVMTFDESSDLYGALTSAVGSDAVNQAVSDAAAEWIAQGNAVRGALGLGKPGNGLHLRLGVEIQSTDVLSLVNDWDLSGLRVLNEPVMLTVRSAGALALEGHVMDGISFLTNEEVGIVNQMTVMPGAAASYRFVAGADLGASNIMAVKADAQEGDLTIAGNKSVITSAGSIDMAASHDVVLQSGVADDGSVTQSTVMVTGRKTELVDEPAHKQIIASALTDFTQQFTHHGGRLDVRAGHDVSAPGFIQLPGNWMAHTGDNGTETWGTLFDSFKQGLGSFGGGNVAVQAAHDILNLGVVAPTSSVLVADYAAVMKDGKPVTDESGNVVYQEPTLSRWTDNGGNVTVKAQGNVGGGVFVLGKGEGIVQAGEAIRSGTASPGGLIPAQPIMLGLMDGQWHVESRGSLDLGITFNPTVLALNNRLYNAPSFFYTYAPDSALHASSAAGGVNWTPMAGPGFDPRGEGLNWYNAYANDLDMVDGSPLAIPQLPSVVPPIVHVSAGGGDLRVELGSPGDAKALVLYPSAVGDLSLFAAGDMRLNAGKLLMSGTDPVWWPSLGQVLNNDTVASLPPDIVGLSSAPPPGSTLHADDRTPVRLWAQGDLAMDQARIEVPKPLELEAEGDIVSPQLVLQHLRDTDRSLVRAGGDIEGRIYPAQKREDRYDDGTTMITVQGPGELRVEAGKSLNLNTSGGINALGNAVNEALPDQSARISILAGGKRAVDLAAFRQLYLAQDAAAQAELIAHVREVLHLPADELSAADAFESAWAMFARMSKANQLGLADKVLQRRFIADFVAGNQPYAQAWKEAAARAKVAETDYRSNAFLMFKNEVVMAEVKRLGTMATAKELNDSTDANINARNQAQRQKYWDELNGVLSVAGLGKGLTGKGAINVASSLIFTRAPGDKTHGGIDLYVPTGDVVVGLDANDPAGKGIVTEKGGSIRAILDGDFQVNSQKAFAIGVGDLIVYDVTGQIDNGRGSNTAVAAPPPRSRLVDGYPVLEPGAATTGSGMAVLPGADGAPDGLVRLWAPVGGVSALDTFVRGPDIGLAGPVKGADNFKGASVSSSSVMAPVVGPSGVSVRTAPATSAGEDAVAGKRDVLKLKNGLLTVELVSLGQDAPAAGVAEESRQKAEDAVNGNADAKACEKREGCEEKRGTKR